jgi:DNA invertase Pin-like site-specific DNA recombinase
MQIIGAFAEFERNLISDRTKAARANKPTWGKRGADKKPRKKRGGFKKRIFYPNIDDSKKGLKDAPL